MHKIRYRRQTTHLLRLSGNAIPLTFCVIRFLLTLYSSFQSFTVFIILLSLTISLTTGDHLSFYLPSRDKGRMYKLASPVWIILLANPNHKTTWKQCLFSQSYTKRNLIILNISECQRVVTEMVERCQIMAISIKCLQHNRKDFNVDSQQ